MSELNLEKQIQDYLDSVYVISHSKASVHNYSYGVDQLAKFTQAKYERTLDRIIAEIKNGSCDVLDVFKDFVIHLDKSGKKPSTIKVCVVGAKGFLRSCGIKIYSEDFKTSVRLPKRVQQREEPMTKEILIRLLDNVPAKLRTIILVAIASGMRVGELVQLKLSDIDFDSNPTRIKIRAETTKTRESRETFLTTESTNSLKDYLTRYFEWKEHGSNDALKDTLIFRRTTKSRKSPDQRKTNFQQINTSTLINSLRDAIKSVPELARLNENGRHMVHFHAFRKYFRTVVGNAVGRDYAEALMGHHFYLDTYYILPDEKKREMYLQAEPFLTISDYAQIERELRAVKQKQKQIEEKQLDLIYLIKDEHVKLPASLEKYVK